MLTESAEQQNLALTTLELKHYMYNDTILISTQLKTNGHEYIEYIAGVMENSKIV